MPGAGQGAGAFLETRLRTGGRAFLQSRLTRMAGAGALFAGAFYTAFNVANMRQADFALHKWVTLWSNAFHLGLVAVFTVVWLICRSRREYSPRVLAWIDAAGVLAACLMCALSAWGAEQPGGRKHGMLLEVNAILIYRSALIPSTGLRTFLIGLAALPPATHAAYLFDSTRAALADQFCTAGVSSKCIGLAKGMPVVSAAIEAALFVLLAAVVSAVTSQVIYGLHQQIRATRTLGQYMLVEKLAEGGMGVVFRATHALLRRPTAVKLLPPDRSRPDDLARFEHEVRNTARLTHPNTIRIYDYGHTPDGVFYYAMELLDGFDLDVLVKATGPMPPPRVVHVLKQICGALAEAHQAGLIHRDIKPANVILCRGWTLDVVKVLDFGLVKELDADYDPAVTGEHAIVGTPAYLAPESIRSASRTGPRSDLYAVGALGYFILTGHQVFDCETAMDMISHHLVEVPMPPSERLGRDLPERLEALILACLQKDPDQRPSSARELLAALERCDDVGPWTEEDARAWWGQEAGRLARAKVSMTPSWASLAMTVDVRERMRRGAGSS